MSLRLLTAAAAGNAMGKTTQGVVELAEVETVGLRVHEQTLRDHYEYCLMFPDPDGDGRIVVVSADGLHAAPEELEAAIKAGRRLMDERHVVELPELAPTAEMMKSLERIARPLAEPAFPWRALELAGDGDRPNRKQRRKAQKAARREQRRRR